MLLVLGLFFVFKPGFALHLGTINLVLSWLVAVGLTMLDRVIWRVFGVILICGFCWLGWGNPVKASEEVTGVTESPQVLEKLVQRAFQASNHGDFANAEGLWSQLIEKFPLDAALWSNRGNVRVSQNKLKDSLTDFDRAIELAPTAPDPYLNRGAALEGLGRWQDAIASYNKVLELNPKDAAAYNNRGNANAGLGEWENAIADYEKAFTIIRDYAFARANYALALYQVGKTEDAIATMKNLVRKYPKFADMRAALTAVLWENGQQGEAESNWVSAIGLDSRYKDLNWVAKVRRWPPQMVSALDEFLNLK
jgi:tetratricopeptide (TPR) repeat protein